MPVVGDLIRTYRITGVMGEGSTGCVYAARYEPYGYRAALKMLRPTMLDNQTAFQLFVNEARAVRRINHPNIVEMTDLMVDAVGRHFFVMELLCGHTLDRVIERVGTLSCDRALRIAAQVCDALAAAHAAGVVHRDLKPSNVFLTSSGGRSDVVKLIDFGVAQMYSAGAACRFEPGVVIGTPAYMSPEQTKGEPVNHRADIYAVGVLLYEMVTGRVPFERDTLYEVIDAQRHAVPPSPRTFPHVADSISERFESLILECLAKDPLDRPATMADLESLLHDLIS